MLSFYEEAADAYRTEEPSCHAAALQPDLLVGLAGEEYDSYKTD